MLSRPRRERREAGFTLTETMVVVVILGLLAAVATPLLSRDNRARRGRDWAKVVAQTLQRARYQAMADRATVHVLIYRSRIDVYEQATPTPLLLSSTPGPLAAGTQTVAIWNAVENSATPPTAAVLVDSTTPPSFSPALPANDIAFSALGSTSDNGSWWIYIRNELLPSGHPDASFLVTVQGLTGFVTANNKVTLP
ncbi:MAG: type II secretion system protein [Polyangia bacterium]|jgi:prepilin-type N-terminal cleavage/methylation domain-containing protein